MFKASFFANSPLAGGFFIVSSLVIIGVTLANIAMGTKKPVMPLNGAKSVDFHMNADMLHVTPMDSFDFDLTLPIITEPTP